MRIAVVRNRKNGGVLGRIGLPSPERYGRHSVQAVMDALRDAGHEVKVLEGDIRLLHRLKTFLGGPRDGRPGGMVFNLSYGIQGEARYAHVPALLEMAGVPYTGAGPRGHLLSLDKALAKTIMQQAGVPTPSFRVLRRTGDDVDGLRFPVVVKPCHESTSNGLQLVRDRADLAEAVARVLGQYRQEALVEEYVEGREITIGILGNDPIQVLPPVEVEFGDRPVRMMTRSDKFHRTGDEPAKVCPARLDSPLVVRLGRIAKSVYRACDCRDYARVDIRLDREGNPFVLEVNSMATLGRGGAYVLAARRVGLGFEDLVSRIVDEAHRRYYRVPAPRSIPRNALGRAAAAGGL